MNYPNKLVRDKEKDQLYIPQCGNSSSQEYQSLQYLWQEIKFQMSLVKSRSKSDLKKFDITTHRLESYMLDSLWRNLHNYVKS